MNRALSIAVAIALPTSLVVAEDTADVAVQAYAREKGVSKREIERGMQNCVWRKDMSAVAVCFRRDGPSLCLVAFRQGDRFLISDVSAIERANFARFGFPHTGCERFLTEPVEWYEPGRDAGLDSRDRHRITFRTCAWKSGKRYILSKPVLLNSKWMPLWQ